MLLLAHHPVHARAAVVGERLGRVLEQVPVDRDVDAGAIVGGRHTSQRGSTAKRLITSSAAAAFSARTVDPPA